MGRNKNKEKSIEKQEEKLEGIKLSIRKKEIYWIIGVMIGLIAVLLLTNYIAKGSSSFTYQTLKFTKSKYGDIPIYMYTYNFKDYRIQPPKEYSFNLLLRNDPRDNDIPVNGEIVFPEGRKEVYVSINGEEFTQCKNSARELATLSGFLTINLFNVKAGVGNPEEANQSNLSYITCDKYPSDAVLSIQTGNETRIDREGNCYKISVANCELLNAIEKFEVQSLIDAKKRQSSNLSLS